MDVSKLDERKARAKAWFESLRDEICTAFERLEDEAPAALYASAPDTGAPGRFTRTPRGYESMPQQLAKTFMTKEPDKA